MCPVSVGQGRYGGECEGQGRYGGECVPPLPDSQSLSAQLFHDALSSCTISGVASTCEATGGGESWAPQARAASRLRGGEREREREGWMCVCMCVCDYVCVCVEP